MADTLLQVQDLEIRYRLAGRQYLQAVDQMSFTVMAGQVVGLVGESGSGKSSVVRAVVGLQQPTGGQVTFGGIDIWRADRKAWRHQIAARIGVVFQDPTSSLNPRMAVGNLLTDPMRIHGIGTKAERLRRAAELLDLVHLPSKAMGQQPRELSGGQRQRIAIARAVALRPELLVADEPTSALDVSIRNQILNLLLDLRDELGLAMLVISHDITAITYLADSIGVMYLGRLVEIGSAEAVHDRFEHPYTATLLSARPTLGTGPATDFSTPAGSADTIVSQPEGCPFTPRCWRSTPECSRGFPPNVAVAADHSVHCLHPLGMPETMSAPRTSDLKERDDGD